MAYNWNVDWNSEYYRPYHPTYPQTYDDTYSLVQKYNRLIAHVRQLWEWASDIQGNWESYTDQEIAKLKQYVDEQDAILRALTLSIERDLTNRIDVLELKVDTEIKELKEFVVSSIDAIKAQIEGLFDEVDRRIDEGLQYILSKVYEIIESTNFVLDPWTGQRNTISGALRNVYTNWNRQLGLTCNQIARFDMTCEQWAAYGLKCRDVAYTIQTIRRFDRRSWNPVKTVFNPQVETDKSLFNLHTYPYTCQEVEDMNQTCEEVGALNRSCWDWSMVNYTGGSGGEGYLPVIGGTINGNLTVTGQIYGNLQGTASVSAMLSQETLPNTANLNSGTYYDIAGVKFFWTSNGANMTNLPPQIQGDATGFSMVAFQVSTTWRVQVLYSAVTNDSKRGLYLRIYRGSGTGFTAWEKFSDVYATIAYVDSKIPTLLSTEQSEAIKQLTQEKEN